MDFEVLPGPSLAELARTAVASAPAAIVAPGRPPGTASPGLPPGAAGSPGLLPPAGGPAAAGRAGAGGGGGRGGGPGGAGGDGCHAGRAGGAARPAACRWLADRPLAGRPAWIASASSSWSSPPTASRRPVSLSPAAR